MKRRKSSTFIERTSSNGRCEVLERLDCGFGNADCGIRNKIFIQALLISIRNPRSPIRNVPTPAGFRKRGKTIETPSGGSPKPGPPNSSLKPVVRFIPRLTHESKLTTTVLTNMDTTQQLHLGIGRIFQGNQLGGNMKGYSTLLTHAFHFFAHTTTSATIVTSNPQF